MTVPWPSAWYPPTGSWRLFLAIVVTVVIAIVVWVWWPAPKPSADSELLKRIEVLEAEAAELKAAAAKKLDEGTAYKEASDAKLEEVRPIRDRRRAVRADGDRRVSAILATPDEHVAAALRDQHQRTRTAIDRIRSTDDGTTRDGSTADPR